MTGTCGTCKWWEELLFEGSGEGVCCWDAPSGPEVVTAASDGCVLHQPVEETQAANL